MTFQEATNWIRSHSAMLAQSAAHDEAAAAVVLAFNTYYKRDEGIVSDDGQLRDRLIEVVVKYQEAKEQTS